MVWTRKPLMKCLTQGPTVIFAQHVSAGQSIHVHDTRAAFFTLYTAPTTLAENAPKDATIRIHVGNRAPIVAHYNVEHEDPILIRNFPIFENEEIWVSCSHANAFIVYGHHHRSHPS